MAVADRTVDFIEIEHCQEIYRVAIRRVAGARRYTLRVRTANRDVVLTMPARGTVNEARKFAQQHTAWIGARIRRLPKPIPFQNGATIPFRGVDHLIKLKEGSRGGVWNEHQVVDGMDVRVIFTSGTSEHVDRRIRDFLKKHARLDLIEAVRRYSGAIGVSSRRVSLRDTSSRWGSCSASGNLNFSWRLILAPSFVLDYLAAHEVAHLKYLNHSAEFWALVRSMSAQTDSAEAWLTAHGAQLHRYGKIE